MTYSKASIVLPVFRQADHIASTVESFIAALSPLGLSHELILVPNGPDDGGPDVCADLARRFDTVRVAPATSVGWGNAVRTGLLRADGDLLCYTNSARTSPATLATILAIAARLPGIVVKANRKTRDSSLRHIGSLLYNLECRSLFDLSNFDINGTPKVFPRSLQPLIELKSGDDMIDAEFLAVCRRLDYLVLEVPVVLTRRRGGSSTTTALSAMRMYAGALELARRLRRELPVRA